MESDILKEPVKFMEKTQALLIKILSELRETVDIISKVDPKRQAELQERIISYYKNVNELSNVLNEKIDTMQDSMEFQVNATVERLMVENLLSFESETEMDSDSKE